MVSSVGVVVILGLVMSCSVVLLVCGVFVMSMLLGFVVLRFR